MIFRKFLVSYYINWNESFITLGNEEKFFQDNRKFGNKFDVKFYDNYNVNLTCQKRIRTSNIVSWQKKRFISQFLLQIQLTFPTFTMAKPNECDANFVDVFSERTDLRSRLKCFCGSIADFVSTKGNVAHIRFYAEPKAINSTFMAVMTAVRDKEKGKLLRQERLFLSHWLFSSANDPCMSWMDIDYDEFAHFPWKLYTPVVFMRTKRLKWKLSKI